MALLALAALLACFAGAVLIRVDVAWTFSLSLAASIFSSNSSRIGFPIGPDRLLFAFGLGLILWRAVSRKRQTGSSGLPPLTATNWLCVAIAAFVAVSAIAHQEFFVADGFFAWLDRLGVVPFVLFYLAPVVYGTPESRFVLLRVLVATGGYLAVVSIFPTVGLESLVAPSYIVDPNVGLHVDRARGPFLEAAADGIALIGCALAAFVAARTLPSKSGRLLSAFVAISCEAATLFTVTRSVWIGAVVAAIIFGMLYAPVRPWLVPSFAAAALAVLGIFASLPALNQKADNRAQSQSPVWDRLNTNAAAWRIVQQKPLDGLGWNRFPLEGRNYLRQADTYPLTDASVGLPVHNVPLSYAAELGILGFALWFTAMMASLVAPLAKRCLPEMNMWRAALGGISSAWFVVAMLTPLGYAFPLALMFTWAGIVAGHVQRSDPAGSRGDQEELALGIEAR